MRRSSLANRNWEALSNKKKYNAIESPLASRRRPRQCNIRRLTVVIFISLTTLVFLAIFHMGGITNAASKLEELSLAGPKKYYNSDLESVFGVEFLPQSRDDPEVTPWLDNHDIKTDPSFKITHERSGHYDHWRKILAAGPKMNDKQTYIAQAGGKGLPIKIQPK